MHVVFEKEGDMRASYRKIIPQLRGVISTVYLDDMWYS